MKLNNNDDSHNSGLNLLIYNMLLDIESHPAWVCGLKLFIRVFSTSIQSSHPAWVCGLKLTKRTPNKFIHLVTPCVGVWIETNDKCTVIIISQSHPAWVCGLKQSPPCTVQTCWSHTLRGCVDWNVNVIRIHLRKTSHTLRGCVDWNKLMIPSNNAEIVVTPCVGVWIETERYHITESRSISVTPCVGVWIETL